MLRRKASFFSRSTLQKHVLISSNEDMLLPTNSYTYSKWTLWSISSFKSSEETPRSIIHANWSPTVISRLSQCLVHCRQASATLAQQLTNIGSKTRFCRAVILNPECVELRRLTVNTMMKQTSISEWLDNSSSCTDSPLSTLVLDTDPEVH